MEPLKTCNTCSRFLVTHKLNNGASSFSFFFCGVAVVAVSFDLLIRYPLLSVLMHIDTRSDLCSGRRNLGPTATCANLPVSTSRWSLRNTTLRYALLLIPNQNVCYLFSPASLGKQAFSFLVITP